MQKTQDTPWDEHPSYAGDFIGVVDWYRVHDQRRLIAALTTSDDVTGTLEDGWIWHEVSPEGRHQVAELEILEGDSLAVETLSESDAERARVWLEVLAPAAVEFLIGELCYGMPKSS